MFRLTFRVLVVLATVSTMVPSGAEAQSTQPDGGGAGVFTLRPLIGSALLDVLTAPREEPQHVGRDRTRGALWGGGIGLVAGGLLSGLSVGSDDENDGFGGSLVGSAATGEAVILGAVLGAGIGALLGATVFAPSRPSAAGDGGGMALSVHPTLSGLSVAARVGVGR